MEKLYSWTAKRAGGSVTVYGKSIDGDFRRIVGVEQITVEVLDGLPAVVATDRKQVRYLLATRVL